MTYDCLFFNNKFVIAKPTGWQWGTAEKVAPFTCFKTEELSHSDTDYSVIVNGQEIMASKIDSRLVGQTEPVLPRI